MNQMAHNLKLLLQHKGVKLLLLVSVIVVSIMVAIPFAGKYYLSRWLLENGADKAAIADIDLNYFLGIVSLAGVDVEQHGDPALSGSLGRVDIGILPLFRNELVVEKAEFSDLLIDIEQYDDGALRIGTIRIDPSVGTENQTVEKKEELSWQISANNVLLKDCIVRFTSSDLTFSLEVQQAELQNLSTHESSKSSGSLRVQGKLNDAPVSFDLHDVSFTHGTQFSGNATFQDLLLKPFSKILVEEAEGLVGKTAGKGNIYFSILETGEIKATFDGDLSATAISVSNTAFNVAGNVLWKGNVTFASDAGGGSSEIKTDGKMDLDSIDLSMEKTFHLRQESLAVEGKMVAGISAKTSLSYDGEITLRNTDITTDTLSFIGDSTTYQGKANFVFAPQSAKVDLQGNLNFAEHTLSLEEKKIGLYLHSGEISADSSLELQDQIIPSGTLDVTMDTIALSASEKDLLRIETFEAAARSLLDASEISCEKMILAGVTIPPSEYQPLLTTIKSVVLTEISADTAFQDIALNNLNIAGIDLSNPITSGFSSQIGNLSAENLSVKKMEEVAVASINIEGGSLSMVPPDLQLALGEMAIQSLDYKPERGAEIEDLRFTDLYGTIEKEKQSGSSSKETSESDSGGITATKEELAQESMALPLKIDKLIVTGKSGLSFADKSLSRSFQARLDIQDAEVNAIDLNEPEKQFTYSLQAIVDGYAPLTLSGKTSPLAKEFYLQQQTTLKNYPLTDLTPYVIDAIGTEFESGRLQLQSEISVVGNTIKSDNTLVFNELNTRTADETLLTDFNNQLPIPLDAAIVLLTDKNRDITLSVPLTGELDNIHFGVGGVISTALTKAISTAVVPYLAYMALGPTGALVYLGGKIGSALIDLDLPTISFAKNSSEIEKEQQEKLDDISLQIQNHLKNDSEKTISICAKVLANEVGVVPGQHLPDEESRKALYQLGDKRAEAVKSFLVNKKGIDKNRLLSCSPGLLFGNEKRGRVEFKE